MQDTSDAAFLRRECFRLEASVADRDELLRVMSNDIQELRASASRATDASSRRALEMEQACSRRVADAQRERMAALLEASEADARRQLQSAFFERVASLIRECAEGVVSAVAATVQRRSQAAVYDRMDAERRLKDTITKLASAEETVATLRRELSVQELAVAERLEQQEAVFTRQQSQVALERTEELSSLRTKHQADVDRLVLDAVEARERLKGTHTAELEALRSETSRDVAAYEEQLQRVQHHSDFVAREHSARHIVVSEQYDGLVNLLSEFVRDVPLGIPVDAFDELDAQFAVVGGMVNELHASKRAMVTSFDSNREDLVAAYFETLFSCWRSEADRLLMRSTPLVPMNTLIQANALVLTGLTSHAVAEKQFIFRNAVAEGELLFAQEIDMSRTVASAVASVVHVLNDSMDAERARLAAERANVVRQAEISACIASEQQARLSAERVAGEELLPQVMALGHALAARGVEDKRLLIADHARAHEERDTLLDAVAAEQREREHAELAVSSLRDDLAASAAVVQSLEIDNAALKAELASARRQQAEDSQLRWADEL